VASGSLAWKLLPPVGGEPTNQVTGLDHLTCRIRPALVVVEDQVLLWGGQAQHGSQLHSGLTIGASGRVAARWRADSGSGDIAALVGDRVVVVGPGSHTAERALVFTPDDPERTQEYISPIARRVKVSRTQSGRVFVVWGGREGRHDRHSLPRGDGAVFDASIRKWSTMPIAPICARSDHVLQAIDDDVVVWGGTQWGDPSTAGPLADGAVYNVASKEWRPMPPSPLSARSRCSFVPVGHRLFIWGGVGHDGTYPGDGALFDPRTDMWALISKAPVRKPGAVAFGVNDMVLLCGGISAGGSVRILIYDSVTDSWMAPDLPNFTPGPASFAQLGIDDVYAWSFVDPNTEQAVLQGLRPGVRFDADVPVDPLRSVVAMGIEVDERLLDYMAGSLGAIHLQLRGAGDPERAAAAMGRARKALFAIPHPGEPDDPLPSYVSPITFDLDGPTFWFDIADAGGNVLDEVLRTLTSALAEAGATGSLTTSGGGGLAVERVRIRLAAETKPLNERPSGPSQDEEN